MAILLTGGGSGGHITPLLAVARELKKKSPQSKLYYIGERGSKFSYLLSENKDIFEGIGAIMAGKFRRYHGEPWLKRIVDIKTIALNVRDAVLAIAGFLQSLYILSAKRPDIIFVKGGYVGLPLGLAARVLRVPYITHDSDATGGLTNKLIGRGAAVNAVGMKNGFYNYPKHKIVPVGVPIREGFKRSGLAKQLAAKQELGLPKNSQVLLVTGGSQGARRINESLAKIVPWLVKSRQDLVVIHQMGAGNLGQYEGYSHPRLRTKEFIDELEKYSLAADLIITRAGASTMAEFSAQQKACIVVPSPFLAGGHQLRNADALQSTDAAVVMNEKQLADTKKAGKTIEELLHDDKRRRDLGKNLCEAIAGDAASRIADLILKYERV
jgi:UDP-N-acetylglucosamine--N-acetylmuramyl-(pentapeptide) pyrophosphoryl-undecaprenol N-acetylglucosamine transferase